MFPYIVLLFFPFIVKFIFYSNRTLDRHRVFYVYISLLPMLILLALKGTNVGSDTPSYIYIFKNALEADILSPLSLNETLEWGYKCFIYLLTKITSNYQWQFVIVGLLVYTSIAKFIIKNAKDPALVIILFITLGYFQFTMTGIRQTIAMSIILFAYDTLKNKALVKFLAIVFLASLFHKSALFFLPTYFVANGPFVRKNILIILASCGVLVFFIPRLLLFSADVLDYNYGIEETTNGYIFFTIILIITFLSFVNSKRILKINQNNIVFLNVNILSLFLWGVRLVSRTAERVSFYFLPASCLMLEEYVMSIKDGQFKREVYFFVVLLCMVFFLYRLYNTPSLYPYQFCDF